MNIFLTIWQRLGSRRQFATKQDLAALEKRIMMDQAQLAQELENLRAQSIKIAKEQSDRSDALAKRIAELEETLRNGVVTTDVEEKLNALKKAQQDLDDTIPDAPAETTAPTS